MKGFNPTFCRLLGKARVNSCFPLASLQNREEMDLDKKLLKCQKEKEEYLAGWQRARADFLNYKKEEGERFKIFFEIERTQLILKILPILDNFQKAKKEFSQNKDALNYLEGLTQIEKQFQKFLEEEGVEEIKAEGEKFDPNFHEAAEVVEPASAEASTFALRASADKSAGKSGEILEVIQKGYQIKGRVIRPAKVKVAK